MTWNRPHGNLESNNCIQGHASGFAAVYKLTPPERAIGETGRVQPPFTGCASFLVAINISRTPIRTILSHASRIALSAWKNLHNLTLKLFSHFTLKNIFRRENTLPIALVVAGLGLIGYNVATAVQPSGSVPDNILYTYLEKDVVTEKVGDSASTPSYQVIATLASAVTAGTAEAADVQDVIASDTTDQSIPTFASQMLTKPKSAKTDGITRQRSAEMTYTVQSGETLSQIARKFGLNMNTILWENRLSANDIIHAGQTVTILPIDGVRHHIAAGDTVASIAKKYQSKPELITVFNNLESGKLPKIGGYITVPDGVMPEAPRPQLAAAPARTSTVARKAAAPAIRFGGGSHRFPYGWCTYWAATKRGGVPWGGNANQWPSNARAYGYATGKTPRAGAIYAEPWLTGYGHVSYVERVNGDGSFTVSEMNYEQWGRTSYRTISNPGGTFIY